MTMGVSSTTAIPWALEGLQSRGLKRILPSGAAMPPAGTFVTLTGISSSDTLGGSPIRALRVRSQADISLPLGGVIYGHVTQGGSQTITQDVESPHNYPNNYNNTWTITGPSGATEHACPLYAIQTEVGYDYLYIKDGSGTTQQTYNGTYSNVWSNWVGGNAIEPNLTSDVSVTYYGFQVDQYQVQVPNTPVPGVTLTLTPGPLTVQSLLDGLYLFNGLSDGTYTITPSLAGADVYAAKPRRDRIRRAVCAGSGFCEELRATRWR